MGKFIMIGERIHCISPAIRDAMANRNPEPILQRAKEQLDAGAVYLDVNIGPAESTGEELMKWAVKLLQENFDNVPLSLDTANKKAIEAGISVYNRSKGKPIINSANAGDRIENIDLAAANGAIILSLCSKAGVPSSNEERIGKAAVMPEIPPPMTRADFWILIRCLCRGCNRRYSATAILTRSLDFCVALSGSCILTPGTLVADVGHLKEIGIEADLGDGVAGSSSWVRGVQEATTTRFRSCSAIFSLIRS